MPVPPVPIPETLTGQAFPRYRHFLRVTVPPVPLPVPPVPIPETLTGQAFPRYRHFLRVTVPPVPLPDDGGGAVAHHHLLTNWSRGTMLMIDGGLRGRGQNHIYGPINMILLAMASGPFSFGAGLGRVGVGYHVPFVRARAE